VLLPGTGPLEALEIAERVLRGVADGPILVGDGRTHDVTVSVGVACRRAAPTARPWC
jgi:two-component system, cell cycle response regulator